MRRPFIGPLSVEAFFEDFLPVKEVPRPSTSPWFTKMARATSEKQMYGFFVSAVNSLFTRFTAFDTSNASSREAGAEYKPDVTIYETEKGSPTRTTSVQTMEMFVEFKHGNSSDPFSPNVDFSYKLFEAASATRDQIIFYSARQRAHQFRTSTFTVGIFGEVARLIRWDNTGFRVTVPIDYSKKRGNRQLVEFFLRLDQMADDREARGWDQTVRDATPEEVVAFSEAVEVACKPQWSRPCRKKMDPLFCRLIKSVGDPSKYLRRKVSILEGSAKRDYIVGRPTSFSKAPAGRTTRGFVAMSVQTKKLVFLKDSWRLDADDLLPEDHWYKALEKCEGINMKNIGAYLHGSDVYATRKFVRCQDKKQRTITHFYTKDLGRAEAMMGYIHHRVVLSELYLPLEMFKDSKHLTNVMYDVAKVEHVHRAGIFHRDLSVGNIMIDTEGNGRLIDFDLARYMNETGARESVRMGTWPFMSTQQLLDPGKIYEVSDELESFFFVLLYEGIHWVAHHKPPGLDVGFIFDDLYVDADGRQTGGRGKSWMYTQRILEKLEFEKSPPFTDLIGNLFRLFSSLATVNTHKIGDEVSKDRDIENVKKLESCEVIIRAMKDAVEREDWPKEYDKVSNCNYPRNGEIAEEDPAGHANLKVVTGAGGASVRAREEDDSDTAPKKRPKIKNA